MMQSVSIRCGKWPALFGTKRVELKTALLVKRDRAAEVHRVGVQLLDGRFTLQADELAKHVLCAIS